MPQAGEADSPPEEEADDYERKGRAFKEGDIRSLSLENCVFPTGEGDRNFDMEMEEKTLMCAPIERSPKNGAKGPVITAALEIQAHSFDFEWFQEDEDTLRVLAQVIGEGWFSGV